MRKTYSPEFKATLVMEVFRGERLLNEIASENNVHPNMLTRWKTEVSAQAEMLGINRTSLYYKPRPSSERDLQLN